MEVNQIWQHYKGNNYKITGFSWCSVGPELVRRIHYQAEDGKGKIFSRTVTNFLELIEGHGQRFKWVSGL